MQAEMDRCAREGTPRPETHAVRAHVPGRLLGLRRLLGGDLPQGVCDHAIKELVPGLRLPHGQLRVLRQPALHQGAASRAWSSGSTTSCSTSSRPTTLRRPAEGRLAYAQAIAWNEDDRDALWERLHAHFTEDELVELGCVIALTFGQQSWIRLLDIDHHQYMAGSDASMAPGFEDAGGARRQQGQPELLGGDAAGQG